MKFFSVFAGIFAVCAFAASYRNPIVNVDAPDPGVVYWEGKYYMVTTGGLPAYRIRVSEDLVNWTDAGYVFTEENHPAWVKQHYWAPEIHIINGHINIYFTGRNADGILCIGVATAPHPTGPWKARDEPIASRPTSILDPTAITDPQTGKGYLLYSNYDKGAMYPFEMYELSDDGLYTVGNFSAVMWWDKPWETWLIEGPHLVYRKGWYYIFYSGNGYTDPDYSIGVARSKSILGPYEKAPVPLFSQAADGAYGHTFTATGHGSIVQIADTDVWYTINHAYWCGTMGGGGPGRIVVSDRMWFAEDGWPYMGQCKSTQEGDLPIPTSAEAAAMKPDLRIIDDGTTKFALETYQGWGCIGSDGSIGADCTKSLFIAHTGLMGPRSLLIESVEKPGYYMRHQDGKIHFHQNDGSDLFKQDSTFFDVAGLADATHVSFRSYNFPRNYLRHTDGAMVFGPWDNTTLMAEDGTFKIHFY